MDASLLTMKLGRCPVCHTTLDVLAIAEDEAARELLVLLATLDAALGRALLAYLSLWRPEKIDMRWDRALRLVREALALESDTDRLARALTETVESIRAKGNGRPLSSHNYLRRVLEHLPPATERAPEGTVAPTSRTAEAMRRLVSGV